jgi:hypothetical protein
LDSIDLTHAAERLQMARELWSPDGHPHPRAGLDKRTHDVPAEKTGPTVKSDE